MRNKKIFYALTFFSVLFLTLITYLTGIEVIYGDEYSANTHNARNYVKEYNVLRGKIFDQNGEVLAYSEIEGEEHKRYYPYLNLYSHVIGYCSPIYGKSLIESAYDTELLGDALITGFFNLKDTLSGERRKGNDLTLTLDHSLQTRASELLGSKTGAVVATNPQTGAILAMVSKPDFNPNQTALANEWESLSTDERSPLLTRATMGLYPPGSVYKIVTSAAMIEQGLSGFEADDNGSIEVGGITISNAGGRAYGHLDRTEAFLHSSNVYYSLAGVELGADIQIEYAEKFLLNKKLDFPLPYNRSRFETGRFSKEDLALTAIGQGKTLVSPLAINLITCAVANGGNIPKPYLVQEVTASNGFVLRSEKPATMAQAILPTTAQILKDDMAETVQRGTGTAARIPGITVCGKTGTAENERTDKTPGATHAVFTAFAPYDDPQIAVTVFLEYGGSGASAAAPIARELIAQYLG